ncbi:DUF5412 family protein [Alkalihalobacillus trypoxylicola]|uniref:Uncharacterized protein n=1 Tax=Alkalihalobacillus trypoxylicola TaxID=519424 RepID=A0A162EP61_9BACI|nr:DUF5412 family protein [Alkalihalobacillus trypoxylicola]KYG33390.1 hypothetical protein AZF04_16890 [Alkalihalobacillus trypoxylicola]
MKKKPLFALILLFFFIFVWNTYDTLTYSFEESSFPGAPGERYSTVTSPKKTFTAFAYTYSGGGAAGFVNVSVEIKNKTTEETHTIYYGDEILGFKMSWLNEETIEISDSYRKVILNVKEDIFDYMGSACRSLKMKSQYRNCYHD